MPCFGKQNIEHLQLACENNTENTFGNNWEQIWNLVDTNLDFLMYFQAYSIFERILDSLCMNINMESKKLMLHIPSWPNIRKNMQCFLATRNTLRLCMEHLVLDTYQQTYCIIQKFQLFTTKIFKLSFKTIYMVGSHPGFYNFFNYWVKWGHSFCQKSFVLPCENSGFAKYIIIFNFSYFSYQSEYCECQLGVLRISFHC